MRKVCHPERGENKKQLISPVTKDDVDSTRAKIVMAAKSRVLKLKKCPLELTSNCVQKFNVN